jgi:hypothetical protein
MIVGLIALAVVMLVWLVVGDADVQRERSL